MDRKDLAQVYKFPEWHRPPTDVNEMRTCTQYPNINSIEFRNLEIKETETKMYPFYEWLESNELQSTVVLATNSYVSRLWNGTLWGYAQLQDVGQKDKEVFKLKLGATTTAMRFIEANLLLVTNANGSVQLWSTQSEMRRKDGYSLFNIAKKTEHSGIIQAMDVMRANGQLLVITGATDRSIRLWNIGACELATERVYRTAHVDSVTGISSKPGGTLFCSCSRDKTFSIWDFRVAKPVIDYHENHPVAYTTCKWNGNHIYVGDESGNLQVYDTRKGYSEPMRTLRIFDRPIHKIRSNGDDSMVILGETSRMKVLDLRNNLNTLYEYDSNDDYVRDICWCRDTKSKSFYTIGYNSHIKAHTLEK